MEVPPMPDQGPSGPSSGDQRPSGPLSGDQGPSGPLSGDQGPSGPLSGDQGPSGEQDLGWRLAEMESRLDAIGERLGHLEESMRGVVADEVQGATAELRRAISELGRRLVRDLPHELARHRDAIVAELRPPPPPPPPPPAQEDEPSAMDDAGVLDMTDPAIATVPDTPEAAARGRGSRLRRRHG